MEETVRIIEGGEAVEYLDTRRERSGPQRHVDVALDAALADAESAFELCLSAVEWLGTVSPVKNREVPRYVAKLVEEVKEVRRMKQ